MNAAGSKIRPSGTMVRYLGKHFEQGLHSAHQMIVDVAMNEPCSFLVRHHVSHSHSHGGEGYGVGSHVVEEHGLAMPMDRMHIVFVTVGHQIPANPLSSFHYEG